MPRRYRALISVPISASTDDEAVKAAVAYAHSLLHPEGNAIAGHLELVGEVEPGDFIKIARVIDEDPHFRHQLP